MQLLFLLVAFCQVTDGPLSEHARLQRASARESFTPQQDLLNWLADLATRKSAKDAELYEQKVDVRFKRLPASVRTKITAAYTAKVIETDKQLTGKAVDKNALRFYKAKLLEDCIVEVRGK